MGFGLAPALQRPANAFPCGPKDASKDEPKAAPHDEPKAALHAAPNAGLLHPDVEKAPVRPVFGCGHDLEQREGGPVAASCRCAEVSRREKHGNAYVPAVPSAPGAFSLAVSTAFTSLMRPCCKSSPRRTSASMSTGIFSAWSAAIVF